MEQHGPSQRAPAQESKQSKESGAVLDRDGSDATLSARPTTDVTDSDDACGDLR